MTEILVFKKPLIDNEQIKIINEYFQKKYDISTTSSTSLTSSSESSINSKINEKETESESEIVKLTTDSEAEIEITSHGVKRTINDKSWNEPNQQKESSSQDSNPHSNSNHKVKSIHKHVPNPTKKLESSILQTEKPLNEFELEKLELEQRKKEQDINNHLPNGIQNNENKHLHEVMKQEHKQEQEHKHEQEHQQELEHEGKQKSITEQQNSNREIEVDTKKRDTSNSRIREPIIEGDSAGIGTANSNQQNKQNLPPGESVCSTNIDPYKGIYRFFISQYIVFFTKKTFFNIFMNRCPN